jgi:geranylgeranyl reductase family protein
MSDRYDTIIIGSGPAGGTAAFFLGQAGQRVLVLEKESLPRYKTCGGGIPLHLLDQFPFSFEHVIETRVDSVSYALNKQMVTIPLPDRSIGMVMRDQFDACLMQHTSADIRQRSPVRNVEEQGDRVLVETRAGETFHGRYLVAADGASSVAARCLGLRREKTLAAAIEVEATVPPEVFRNFAGAPLFIFGEIRLGYLWVFPKASHLSVGIMAVHPKPGELQAVLKRVMERYQIPLHDTPMHGHPIPLYTRRQAIATANCMLAGDAAGLVDPLNGEGIRFAIKSGRLASEAILAGNPGAYPDMVWRAIGRGHTISRGLAWLFYHFPRTCFELGVRNPYTVQAFVGLLSDRIGYPEVLLRLFGSLPIFLAGQVVSNLSVLLTGGE